MKKQELEQYRYLLKEVAWLEEERTKLLAGMVGGVRITDLPKAKGSNDPMGEVMVKALGIAEEISNKLAQLLNLKAEIERAIEKLEGNERMLIRLRYFEGKTWQAIADDMHYTYQWVCVLHNRILAKLK